MDNFGTQVKFIGNTCMQLSSVVNSGSLPTVAIEMTTLDDMKKGWANKLVFQIDPIKELPTIARFLVAEDRLSAKDLVVSRAMANSKALTLRWQDNGLWLGLYHNKSPEGKKFSKVLGENQIFCFRLIVLSRLAAIYGVTISDVVMFL